MCLLNPFCNSLAYIDHFLISLNLWMGSCFRSHLKSIVLIKNWLIYLSLDYDISQSFLKFFFANSLDLVILNLKMLSKNYERILCYLSVISTFLRSDYHSLILKNANLSNYPYERSHSNRNVNLFLYFLFASFKNNCTLKN
jgi:hypothetical protein